VFVLAEMLQKWQPSSISIKQLPLHSQPAASLTPLNNVLKLYKKLDYLFACNVNSEQIIGSCFLILQSP